MTKKYTINFARPVIERIHIEVTASCEEEAIFSAVHTLMTDSTLENQWSGKFDQDNYTGFVESVVSQDDMDEFDNIGVDTDAFGSHRKYLILQADMDLGEGGIIPQPWLMPLNPFMIADLCQDWQAQLLAFEEGELDDYIKTLQPEKSAMILPFPNKNKKPET